MEPDAPAAPEAPDAPAAPARRLGETDLTVLVRSMQPRLRDQTYVWASVDTVPEGCVAFATVAEDEGVTLVLDLEQAVALGIDYTFPSACITLEVHSSLEAVGLTAAFARALADVGLSCNVVAGFHHDHLFVPWGERDEAMAALGALSVRRDDQ